VPRTGRTCERLTSSRSFSQEHQLTSIDQDPNLEQIDTDDAVDGITDESAAAVLEDTTSAQITVIESDPVPTQTFAEFGILPQIADALSEAGILTPFPIQAMTLPIALSGSDVIGQARTGTGKTLAFGIPTLERLVAAGVDTNEIGRTPRALVVVPTRELCVQVTEDLRRAGSKLGISLLSVYGGRAYEPQVEALRKGVDVVVGTPGRLLDLARQGHVNLSQARTLVLDEADEMLDLGFLPDVEAIFALVPDARQTMLFSATMPAPIVALSRRFLDRPVHIRAEMPDENRTVPTTHQHVFRAHAMDKAEMLSRVLQAEGRGLSIVFTRTKRTADKVAADLVDRGFAAAAVHGDLGQGAREQALRAFRAGKIDVLVATDVAARGIDGAGVTHVVNYQCPEDEKVYLHRIGRTGRAGESGVAVTFVDWDDIARWQMVNKALELPFPDPPETYSTSEHLYSALDIPKTAKGTLPRASRTREGLAAEQVEDLGETGRKRRAPRSDAPRSDAPRAGSSRGRAEAPASSSASGSTSTSEHVDAAEKPSRNRNRSRNRTRGGGAAASGAAAAAEGTSAPDAGSGTGGVTAGGADSATGDGPKRRRRRGGRGRGAGANAGNTGDQPMAESTSSVAEAS
jgi:superfamily II DNA/RNA helicase